ncbi:aminoacyl-tRNA hydrolase [Tenacibaculum discolor]|uniref:Aminoacyl-tRNA hydrolase n=1 Tax=Tenacibaculum discolor TaxID=361581 RepID=A0A2G1BTZ3_9FLAO|nr:alternative ribosome rescue aminoacyl-tRNA hydrolase ArfB [Tenacibaculum discolor]MDP2541529.1 alternative ribosome rescue aminoacyl-tRNA hydrolase ArfB [Tenacibaculum discolor]PHN97486.1 aminoacyl-tRNA hydrolase [Tenacibaculum discolor]PHO01497.1 aminoacyl-tRNA hydrolase [Rhodobacteraceae bacterium 4F10]
MNKEQLLKELNFKAVRSSGAGGQHVNKVSSKVELSFTIEDSLGLSDKEKALLLKNLTNRLSKDHTLILSSQESRSQHRNKELVTERFFNLLAQALVVPKVRKATKPKKAAIAKRLDAKKQQAEKKENRKKFRF